MIEHVFRYMAKRNDELGSGLILCCRGKDQDPGSYTKSEPGAPRTHFLQFDWKGRKKHGSEDPPLQLPALGLWPSL